MVNAEKHRKKLIENNIQYFINSIDGTEEKQRAKRKSRLDNSIKPYLNSRMNLTKQIRNEKGERFL